jgi:DNA-binding PadR family transcriptional regulator
MPSKKIVRLTDKGAREIDRFTADPRYQQAKARQRASDQRGGHHRMAAARRRSGR